MELLNLFASHQEMSGWTAATIKRRMLTVRQFARWIAPRDLATAGLLDVESFLASKPSARTRHAYRSDLRVFYAWAVKRDLLGENPAGEVEPIKVPKSLPHPLRDRDTMILLDAGRLRTRRMVALALYAGLRCGEIAALRAEHVRFDDGQIDVRGGKGGKDRTVPIVAELRPWLEGLPESGPVFPGSQDGHVTASSVSYTLRRHMRRRGVEGTPHQLRHTFGTEAARSTGGNMPTIARWMGHESMNTTMGYVGLVDEGDAAAVARMFNWPDSAA